MLSPLRRDAFSCLALCYLLFIVLGAVVFTVVEKPAEEELRARVEELRRSFLQENPCVRESRLSELMGKALAAHRSDVAVLTADGNERRCDLTSSLYFVIATLTTMGSDSYTPKSDEAKFFCIFYCTLGIPLNLLLLSLLSSLLLPVVTHAPVHRLQSYWGMPYTRATLVHATLLSVLVLLLLFLLPALLVCVLEPDSSFLDALFFCFVTLSTVGQGGNTVGRTWSPAAKETLELLTTCYLLVGLVMIMTLKDTVLQVPWVCAVVRFFSSPQYAELEGIRLNELVQSEVDPAEEHQYSQAVCTVSSTPLELLSPHPGHLQIDNHRDRLTFTAGHQTVDNHSASDLQPELFKCSNTN